MDDVPIRTLMGSGKARTFEELLEEQLKQASQPVEKSKKIIVPQSPPNRKTSFKPLSPSKTDVARALNLSQVAAKPAVDEHDQLNPTVHSYLAQSAESNRFATVRLSTDSQPGAASTSNSIQSEHDDDDAHSYSAPISSNVVARARAQAWQSLDEADSYAKQHQRARTIVYGDDHRDDEHDVESHADYASDDRHFDQPYEDELPETQSTFHHWVPASADSSFASTYRVADSYSDEQDDYQPPQEFDEDEFDNVNLAQSTSVHRSLPPVAAPWSRHGSHPLTPVQERDESAVSPAPVTTQSNFDDQPIVSKYIHQQRQQLQSEPYQDHSSNTHIPKPGFSKQLRAIDAPSPTKARSIEFAFGNKHSEYDSSRYQSENVPSKSVSASSDVLYSPTPICSPDSPDSASVAESTSRKLSMSDEPPVSALVQTMFFRNKNASATAAAAASKPAQPAKPEPVIEARPDPAAAKLAALEAELDQYAQLNRQLKAAHVDALNARTAAEQMVREFTEEAKRLVEERQTWEDEVKEERAKLAKQAEALERRARQIEIAARPSKSERDEIELLKEQSTRALNEAKDREMRARAAADRSRSEAERFRVELDSAQSELRAATESHARELEFRETQWVKERSSLQKQLLDLKNELHRTKELVSAATSGPSAGNQAIAVNVSSINTSVLNQSKETAKSKAQPQSILKKSGSTQALPPGQAAPSSKVASQPQQKSASDIASPPPHSSSHDELAPKTLVSRSATALLSSDSDSLPGPAIDEVRHADGKIERVYSNGLLQIVFSNRTEKLVYPNGKQVVTFANGDIKKTFPNKRVVYFYAGADTHHITEPDGTEVYFFGDQQKETHFPDGSKEIVFADNTIKLIRANGDEECEFPNGTRQCTSASTGATKIEYTNGRTDIIKADGTRVRYYADGTARVVLPDGHDMVQPGKRVAK